jgi:hypothetical protein
MHLLKITDRQEMHPPGLVKVGHGCDDMINQACAEFMNASNNNATDSILFCAYICSQLNRISWLILSHSSRSVCYCGYLYLERNGSDLSSGYLEVGRGAVAVTSILCSFMLVTNYYHFIL